MKKRSLLTTIALALVILSLSVSSAEVAHANFKTPMEIESPVNTTYKTSNVPLSLKIEILDFYRDYYGFTVKSFLYSLDEQANVTMSVASVPAAQAGGVPYHNYQSYRTLTGLSEGSHNLQVYYENQNGIFQMGSVQFTVRTVPVVYPKVSNLSIENKTYNIDSLPLTFIVDQPVSWMGYSLDAQANVTVSENTTLIHLSAGNHSLVVYANDTKGNMGKSDAVNFAINSPLTPSSTLPPTDSPSATPTPTPSNSTASLSPEQPTSEERQRANNNVELVLVVTLLVLVGVLLVLKGRKQPQSTS